MTDIAEPEQSEGLRLHMLGLFIGFVNGLPGLFFPIAAALFGAGRSDKGALFMPFIIFAVLGLSLFFRWLSWTRFFYHIGDEEIRIESGLLGRTARSIPYERIQDVSVEQKPLARIFGLGEVKFETGSGTGDEAKLSYVSIAEAERLRELVRNRKSGLALGGQTEITGEPAVQEIEAETLFAMDNGRVVILGLFSFSLIVFAVLGGAAQQFDFLLPFNLYDIGAWLGVAKDNGAVLDSIGWSARILGGIIGLLALIAVGIVTGLIRTLLREYGFRLDNTPKGFRRRRGLLTLTDTVMPIHRVQAATIQTGPVRKLWGWYALKFVSLAADSDTKKGEDSDHAAAPLATMDEIARILAAAQIDRADPGLPFTHGRADWWFGKVILAIFVMLISMTALLLAANAGAKASLLLLPLAFVAGLFYFQWRNNSYALDSDQLFVRRGWWQERMTIMPQVKIQTVEIQQGPYARLRGLARINLGIAGGTLEVIALPIEVAKSIQSQIIDAVAKVDYSRLGPRNR